MPTCTHINYHMEAQRKQRQIEKRKQAMLKMEQQLEEDERLRKEEEELLSKMDNEDREAKMKELALRNSVSKRKPTQGDMRIQQKILRDNGLTMGNVNATFLS